MKNRSKMAFDIDGVLADSWPVIRDVILKAYGVDLTLTPAVHVPGVAGVPFEDVCRTINDGLRHQNVRPYPRVDKRLVKLNVMEGPIVLVTARPETVREATLAWLARWFPSVEFELVCDQEDKLQALKERGIRIFVEDRLKNANDLSSHMNVYLVNRPWNMGREENWNVIRVDCASEAVDKYLGSLKRAHPYLDI